MSSPPAIRAGSCFGPMMTKSLYMTGKALHAVTFAQELIFGRLRVNEDHVRIAAAREVERLPGAERDDAHLDACFPLEQRQDVPEQPGLLGGRRRGNGDEPLRERARARTASAMSRPQSRTSLLVSSMAALL